MNLAQFISIYNGQAIDYDGGYGVQCVDLIKLYCDKVLNLEIGALGNAHEYYDNFNNLIVLKNNFIRIANTPKFKPEAGDIMVWNTLVGGGNGHIAICTGESTLHSFYSYDQNWNGKAIHKVKHNYRNVLGVLRPKTTLSIKDGDHVLIKGIVAYTGENDALVEIKQQNGASQHWFNKDQITRG